MLLGTQVKGGIFSLNKLLLEKQIDALYLHSQIQIYMIAPFFLSGVLETIINVDSNLF